MSLLGDLADSVGTALNLPELGWSEGLSGGTTANTGRVPYTDTGGWLNTGSSSSIPIIDAARAATPATNDTSSFGLGDTFASATKSLYGDFGGSGTSSGSGSGYSADDVAYIDDLIANYNRQLGRTDTGLKQGLSQLENSFNKEQSRQNQLRGRALEDFSMQREGTDLAKGRAIGQIDTNARTLADSLRRRLGMAGGTDSSAFKFAAPQAVARQASGERTDVLSDYGQNYRVLDTSEKRATEDFENLLADLVEQRRTRESGLRSGVLEQKNQISEALANAAREKAAILGGGYSAARSASAPYTNDIASRESQIDSLFSKFQTPYSVQDVKVNTPSLRDYTVDRAAINANQGSSSTYSPYEQLLKKRNEESAAL
jgi:hypothetical protein